MLVPPGVYLVGQFVERYPEPWPTISMGALSATLWLVLGLERLERWTRIPATVYGATAMVVAVIGVIYPLLRYGLGVSR